MMKSKGVESRLWPEAVTIECHVTNRVKVRTPSHKTPYELLKGKKPKIYYLHIFGSLCRVAEIDEISNDDGIFLGYAENMKTYTIYNFQSNAIEERFYVIIHEVSCDGTEQKFAIWKDPFEIQESNPHVTYWLCLMENKDRELQIVSYHFGTNIGIHQIDELSHFIHSHMHFNAKGTLFLKDSCIQTLLENFKGYDREYSCVLLSSEATNNVRKKIMRAS